MDLQSYVAIAMVIILVLIAVFAGKKKSKPTDNNTQSTAVPPTKNDYPRQVE